MKTLSLFLCSSICMLSPPSFAQFNTIGKGEGWTAGVGLIVDWSAYQETKQPDIVTIPYVAYDWENAHLGVDGFAYQFYSQEEITVSLVVDPRWSFTDPEDSTLFSDIERDAALEIGFNATLGFAGLDFSGQFLTDLSDTHDGYELSFDISLEQALGPVALSVSVGYAFRDKRLSLHLYGIKPEEARDGLNTFLPDHSWTPFIHIDAFLELTETTGVYVFAQYEGIAKANTMSPLIDKDREANVGIAFLKTF